MEQRSKQSYCYKKSKSCDERCFVYGGLALYGDRQIARRHRNEHFLPNDHSNSTCIALLNNDDRNTKNMNNI